MINDIFLGVGLIDRPIAWTADPGTGDVGGDRGGRLEDHAVHGLLILAALQILPSEVYEAARVDGFNPVKVFFKVTLPLIRPALMVAIIFRALDALRIFDLIYVLTGNSARHRRCRSIARQQLVDFQEVGLRLGRFDTPVPDHRRHSPCSTSRSAR